MIGTGWILKHESKSNKTFVITNLHVKDAVDELVSHNCTCHIVFGSHIVFGREKDVDETDLQHHKIIKFVYPTELNSVECECIEQENRWWGGHRRFHDQPLGSPTSPNSRLLL